MTPTSARAWLTTVPLAHRGLWGDDVPENSLAAFAAANRAGVGIELDVRAASDGRPVVFHDRRLARLTGATGTVDAHTSGELGELLLGTSDQRIPPLAAALAAAGDVPVMVEVKVERAGAGRVSPAVAAALAGHDGPTCVASFNPAVLRWFRRNRPDVPRVLVAAARQLGRSTGPPGRDDGGASGRGSVLATGGTIRLVDPVAISVAVGSLESPVVTRYRSRGGVVVAWTIRTAEQLAQARTHADGLIFEGLAVGRVGEQAPGFDDPVPG